MGDHSGWRAAIFPGFRAECELPPVPCPTLSLVRPGQLPCREPAGSDHRDFLHVAFCGCGTSGMATGAVFSAAGRSGEPELNHSLLSPGALPAVPCATSSGHPRRAGEQGQRRHIAAHERGFRPEGPWQIQEGSRLSATTEANVDADETCTCKLAATISSVEFEVGSRARHAAVLTTALSATGSVDSVHNVARDDEGTFGAIQILNSRTEHRDLLAKGRRLGLRWEKLRDRECMLMYIDKITDW